MSETTSKEKTVVHLHTRVLVVEDHPASRYLIKRILERLGCRIDSAERIAEAIALAGTRAYDVIFLDLSLTALDAKAAVSVLRGIQPDARRVPVIALTDSATPPSREQLRAAGIDDYIPRPVSADPFKAALKIWLERPAHPDESSHQRFPGKTSLNTGVVASTPGGKYTGAGWPACLNPRMYR